MTLRDLWENSPNTINKPLNHIGGGLSVNRANAGEGICVVIMRSGATKGSLRTGLGPLKRLLKRCVMATKPDDGPAFVEIQITHSPP